MDNVNESTIINVDKSTKNKTSNEDNMLQLNTTYSLDLDKKSNANDMKKPPVEDANPVEENNDEPAVLTPVEENVLVATSSVTMDVIIKTELLEDIRNTNDKEDNAKSAKYLYLWIYNISKTTKATNLKFYLSKFGKIVSTKIVTDGESCYGYAVLNKEDDLKRLMNNLDNTYFEGKKIKLSLKNPVKENRRYHQSNNLRKSLTRKVDINNRQSNESCNFRKHNTSNHNSRHSNVLSTNAETNTVRRDKSHLSRKEENLSCKTNRSIVQRDRSIINKRDRSIANKKDGNTVRVSNRMFLNERKENIDLVRRSNRNELWRKESDEKRRKSKGRELPLSRQRMRRFSRESSERRRKNYDNLKEGTRRKTLEAKLNETRRRLVKERMLYEKEKYDLLRLRKVLADYERLSIRHQTDVIKKEARELEKSLLKCKNIEIEKKIDEINRKYTYKPAAPKKNQHYEEKKIDISPPPPPNICKETLTHHKMPKKHYENDDRSYQRYRYFHNNVNKEHIHHNLFNKYRQVNNNNNKKSVIELPRNDLTSTLTKNDTWKQIPSTTTHHYVDEHFSTEYWKEPMLNSNQRYRSTPTNPIAYFHNTLSNYPTYSRYGYSEPVDDRKYC